MAIVDQQKELNILREGRKRGLSDEQIKTAVTNFRNSTQQPTQPTAQQPTVQQSKPEGIERFTRPAAKVLGTIFGGEKIGEAIGTKIAPLLVPKEQRQFIDKTLPSAKALAGDVASSAAGLVPFTRAGSAALRTGGLLARVGKSAGIGAVIGGGQAAKEDTGILRGLTTGATVGGAIPVIGKGLSQVGQQIKQLPDRFIRSALGRSKLEILKDLQGKPEKSLSQFVLKTKKVGTANKLIGNAEADINSLNTKVTSGLKGVPITKNKITNKSILQKVVNEVNKEGGSITPQEVNEIVTRLAPQAKGLLTKPSMALKTGNSLRSSLDKTLGDRAFLNTQLTFNKDVLRKFTNILREEVKTKGPSGTRELFEELTNNIRMRDALLDRIAKQGGNQVLSFGDFIGGGLGGVFGGGIGGAVAGVGARRVLESVPFKTGVGVGLDVLIRKAEPILQKLAPAERAIILNLIKSTQKSNQ